MSPYLSTLTRLEESRRKEMSALQGRLISREGADSG